jgi:hypothetical protein
MRSTATRNANANYQAPRNWDAKTLGECGDLSVRVDSFNGIQDMVSTWKPDADDLRKLNEGGVIELHLLGPQPPVLMEIVDPVGVVTVEDRRTSGIAINEDGHGFGHDEHGPAYPL